MSKDRERIVFRKDDGTWAKKRKDAEKVFGDDTSYFWYNSKGLRAVLRGFGLSDFGPFCVVADFVPGDRGSGSGVRSASR